MATLSKDTPNIILAQRSKLNFKPLTIKDIPRIYSILRKSGYRTCDYSIGGIYMWKDYFNYEFCIYLDTLFIKGLSEADRHVPAFSLPIGGDFKSGIDLLVEYCRENQCKLLLSAVPESAIEELEKYGFSNPLPLFSWSDYLYDINCLASLTGKAYNKKRNHVNRFMSENPDWTLETLTPDNSTQVIDFHNKLAIGTKADQAMATYENNACLDVLKNFEHYPFEGAILRDSQGKIVAYTIGEIIGDTLILHIEKMNHEINGAGETINKLFAASMQRLHPTLKYINREDDAGDPGLRKAKESYHPCALLKKYDISM